MTLAPIAPDILETLTTTDIAQLLLHGAGRYSDGLDEMEIRAGGYYRISDDAELRGLGVGRQRDETHHFADRRKWPIVEEYTDNDKSATRKKGRLPKRPDFDRLCRDIMAGKINAVLAWELDRLFRDPLEAEIFWLLCERFGVALVATTGDEVNIVTGEGIMVARIKAAVAADEVRKMSKRWKAKHRQMARDGLPHGGPRRYGFEPNGMVWRDEEVVIIREIAAELLSGRSGNRIAADLNKRGLRSTRGDEWTATRITQLMGRNYLVGRNVLNGKDYPCAWDPILTVVEQTAILNRIAANRLGYNTAHAGRGHYFLSGLCWCGRCEQRMRGRHLAPRMRPKAWVVGDPIPSSYICHKLAGHKNCGSTSVRCDRLEDHVVEEFLGYLRRPETRSKLAAAGESRDEVEPKLEELRQAREDSKAMAKKAGRGDLSKDEWEGYKEGANERIRELEQAIQRLTKNDLKFPDPDVVLAEWNKAVLLQQQEWMRAYIEKIAVAPTGRGGWAAPIADRVDISWRL